MTLTDDPKKQLLNFFQNPEADRFIIVNEDHDLIHEKNGKQAKAMFLGALSSLEMDRSPVSKDYSDVRSYLTVIVTPGRHDLDGSLENIAEAAAWSTISGIRGGRIVAASYHGAAQGEVMLFLSRDIWYTGNRVTRGFPDDSLNATRRLLEDLAAAFGRRGVPAASLTVGPVTVQVDAETDEEEGTDDVSSGMIDSVLSELRHAGREIERVLVPLRDKVANSPRTAASLNVLADGLRSFSGRLGEIASKIERK